MYHHPPFPYPPLQRLGSVETSEDATRIPTNWLLAVLALGVMLATILGAVVLSLSVSATIRSSGVLNAATLQAEKSLIAQRELGTPIEVAGFPSGAVTFGQIAHADVTIPVEGPKGPAILRAVADHRDGKWVFTSLVLEKGSVKTPIH